MQYNLAYINELAEKAPRYHKTPYIFCMGEDWNSTEINRIVKALRRETKKNPAFAWYLVSSTTDSNTIKGVYFKSTRGRPQKEIVGKKIPLHCHLLALSTDINKSAWNSVSRLKKTVEKKNWCKLETSTQGISDYLQYEERQADHIYQSNNFDFDYFLNPCFSEMTFEDNSKYNHYKFIEP